MDASIEQEWIAALRSGKYKQGQKFLNQGDNTFCCLGVLCELLVAKGQVHRAPDYYLEYVGYHTNPTTYTHQVQFPDDSILDLVALDRSFAETLAGANDAGTSFGTIADSIELHDTERL